MQLMQHCNHHAPASRPKHPVAGPAHISRKPCKWHARLAPSHVMRRSQAPQQPCVSCRGIGQQRDLWAYNSTQVQEMNLDTLKFLHRTSYGHRNRRTVVVVVYDPEDPACQASEFEVERLAAGLQHVPQVLVTKLNLRATHTPRGAAPVLASPSSSTPTAHFVEGILQVQQLPAVLLYPEAAPGMVRYQGGTSLTAERLLAALNQCQQTVLPTRPPLQLQGLAQPFVSPASAALPSSSSEAVVQSGAAAASHTASRGAAAHAITNAANDEAVVKSNLQLTRHGYWTAGKMWFWGGIVAASLATIAWEKWIGPYLDLRALQARQQARAAGKADMFDEDTNIDDLWRLRMDMQQTQAIVQQQPIDVSSSNVTSHKG